MAGGGDHGMGAGIDLFVTIWAGESMEEFHLGMPRYLMIGERITETIFGEVTHGTIIISARVIFKDTGELGIKPTIGIDRSIENLRTLMMENRIVVGINKGATGTKAYSSGRTTKDQTTTAQHPTGQSATSQPSGQTNKGQPAARTEEKK